MKQITVEDFSHSNVDNWTKGYTDKQKVEFSIYCVELVIDLYVLPNEVPNRVIQAARDWALDPSDDNKCKCKDFAHIADELADELADCDYGSAEANYRYDVIASVVRASANAAGAVGGIYGYNAAAATAYAAAYAKPSIKEDIVSYLLGKQEQPKETKHKHYDMIVAKAANMDLVVFVKCGNNDNWKAAESPSEFPLSTFPDVEYFASLPQHKEACLHWLNGGESQVLHSPRHDWRLLDSYEREPEWFSDSVFMESECQIRIKPKKEINQTCADIYVNTQELAEVLASIQGWDADVESIRHDHKNVRSVSVWSLAVAAQEFLIGHEMSDIIEDLEESGYFNE